MMMSLACPSNAAFAGEAEVRSEAPVARILCVGPDSEQLLRIQRRIDGDFDFVLVTNWTELKAALRETTPFDLIISDGAANDLGDESLLDRVRTHSPDAERIVLARRVDPATRALVTSDVRVMRLLLSPCPTMVLREAVADALLRHRARALRASTTLRPTPIGGHPCAACAEALR